MNNMKKLYSWLGLCMRSGNLVSGEDTTLRDVKSRRLSMVLVSEDASDNTKKLFKDKCSYRNIELLIIGTKVDFGNSIGKSPRSVLGIKDENMAIKVRSIVGEFNGDK